MAAYGTARALVHLQRRTVRAGPDPRWGEPRPHETPRLHHRRLDSNRAEIAPVPRPVESGRCHWRVATRRVGSSPPHPARRRTPYQARPAHRRRLALVALPTAGTAESRP